MREDRTTPTYLNTISVICAFLVPLLVTGPFLPDLTLSMLSVWFLYYSLKHKIYYVYLNSYFYTFISFCLVCLISSLLSDNIRLSFESSLFYFRIGIFALLISYLIDNNQKIINYFYFAFIITFSALIIDGYIQYFTGSNLLGYKLYHTMRVSSFFEDELILGSYLSRLFPLFFALFVARTKKYFLEIYIVSIIFIAIDVLIFMAGERSSFIMLNLSTLFIVVFITKYKFLRICIFIVSIAIITFLTINDDRLYSRYVESPIKSMGLENKSKEKFIFTEAHDSLYRTSWNMFLDIPILGHGPKLFRVKCMDPRYAEGNYPCSSHPHNFYFQLLAETGIVGFSFLVGLCFYFIYLMMKFILSYFKDKTKYLSDYQICLLAGLLITIWPITSNGNFFSNHLMLFYSLQMGFFRKKV